MSGAAALYTAEVLGLAVRLADYPLNDDLPRQGSARAPLCGSRVTVGLSLDALGRIDGLGLKVHACAIGQAAAALFADAAQGRTLTEIAAAEAELSDWLTDDQAPMPVWPGLEKIAAARAYPARHGAILLSWKAALDALP